MKKRYLLSPLFVLSALQAHAQDVPKFDIYAGYSFMQISSASTGEHLSSSGWEAAATWNLSRSFGLTADFDGNYCCSGQYIYTYMAGPQLSFRKEKATFFLHGLLGGAHALGLSTSGTEFAWAVGGGVDWDVKPGLAIRLPQLDYLATSFLNGTQSDWRLSAGLVFKLGKH
jgi:opacity protein-like surface antigen